MSFIIDGTNGATFPSGTNAQAAPAKILQVVQGTYSTGVTTASSTYVTTGLTASITPLFSTSKILILVNQAGCLKYTSNTSIAIALYRASTAITYFGGRAGQTDGTGTSYGGTLSTVYLDSPATTSSTTYTTYFASNGNSGTVLVQDNNGISTPVSTITLMEIAQ